MPFIRPTYTSPEMRVVTRQGANVWPMSGTVYDDPRTPHVKYHIPVGEFDSLSVDADMNETRYVYERQGEAVYEHIEGLYGPVFSDYVGSAKFFRDQEIPAAKDWAVIDDVDDEDERELAQEFSDFLTRTPGMSPEERAKALVDIMKNLDWEPGSVAERLRVQVRDTERERDEALQSAYEEVEIEPVFDDLPAADVRPVEYDDDYYEVTSADGRTVKRYKSGTPFETALRDLEDRTRVLDEQIKAGIVDAETVKERLAKWMKK